MVLELADSSCLMVDRGHIGLEYVCVCEDKPENCRYYFEMSHLIPNLKCHIERVSSLYLKGGDSNENISDFGG